MATKLVVFLLLGCFAGICLADTDECATAPFYYFFEFACTAPNGNTTCADHCRCAHGMAGGYCNPNFQGPSFGTTGNPPCICSTTQMAPPVLDTSLSATLNPLSCTNQERAIDALCKGLIGPTSGLPYICGQDCRCAHGLTDGVCQADPTNPSLQICQCW